MTDNSSHNLRESYAITFNTPTGIAVLDHLYTLFYDRDGFDKDPYVHARNAGQRSVVKYLMQMRDANERDREQQTQGEQE